MRRWIAAMLLLAWPAGAYGPAFGRLPLGTFIGPGPPTEALKNALLGRTP